MRKTILLFLMLMAAALAGCLSRDQATPTLSPTSEAPPIPTVALVVPTETTLLIDSGCTAITQKPTPGPTAESIFPPVGATDWVKGPASARVTIIEYSDFQ